MERNKEKNVIPKIIHQVWINDSWKDPSLKRDVPKDWKKSQQEWQRIHPDWSYILWTDDLVLPYLEKNHPEYVDFYKNYEYLIQRADMIRYFILYDFGGVYCDLDLYPVENIEKYLNFNTDYFVYSANTPGNFTNCFMISKGQSPIFLEIFNELKKPLPVWAITKHFKILKSTGPMMLNSVLNHTNYDFTVLPSSKFNPYTSYDELSLKKDNIVLMQLEGKSWNSFDSTICNFINKYSTFFILFGIFSLLMIIIGLIYYSIKYKKCRESKVCIA